MEGWSTEGTKREDKTTVIRFRVTFASGETEIVERRGFNETVMLAMAAASCVRYDRKTGARDPVTAIEFWERVS